MSTVKRVIRNVRTFSYSVKGQKGVISGAVINGADTDSAKAFVVVVRFGDKAGKLIPGPYEGLSYSKVGAYKYIAGGTKDAPAPFTIKLKLPEGAVRADVVLSSWDCEEPVQLTGDIQVGAAWTVLAQASKVVTADKTSKNNAPLSVPVHLEDHYAYEFPKTPGYAGVDFAIKGQHHYSLSVNTMLDEDGVEKPFLLQIGFIDKTGKALTATVKGLSQSVKYGTFTYLPDGEHVISFIAPEDAVTFRVTPHPWTAKNGKLAIKHELTLKALPREVVASVLSDQLHKLFKNADPDGAFLCIYTGTKRIGEGNRANRSMMFARESANLGISTIYTYSPTEGETDYTLTNDKLLQVPLDYFDALSGEIAARVKCKNKLFLGSFPDATQCRNIGLYKQMGWGFVYECRDDWEEFASVGSAKWYDEAFERFSTEQASHVFCVSPMLRRKMQRYTRNPDKVLLSPNATTDDFLASAEPIRAEIKKRPKQDMKNPRIGYFGHLTDHWFDWGALLHAAHALPHATFEVIGFDMPDLKLPENVHYLGSKPHDEIIEIASHWDVGTIPFKPGKLSRAVDPIKIYEYMALGLRVVSTPMGDLDNFPMTFTYEEFGIVDALKQAIDYHPTAQDWKKVEDILTHAQWRRRLIDLLTDSGLDFSAAKKEAA